VEWLTPLFVDETVPGHHLGSRSTVNRWWNRWHLANIKGNIV